MKVGPRVFVLATGLLEGFFLFFAFVLMPVHGGYGGVALTLFIVTLFYVVTQLGKYTASILNTFQSKKGYWSPELKYEQLVRNAEDLAVMFCVAILFSMCVVGSLLLLIFQAYDQSGIFVTGLSIGCALAMSKRYQRFVVHIS